MLFIQKKIPIFQFYSLPTENIPRRTIYVQKSPINAAQISRSNKKKRYEAEQEIKK